MKANPIPLMHTQSIQFLSSSDPVMARLISKVGPCELRPDRKRSPFQGLVQAVAHQQLNGKAASTILGRFVGLFEHGRFPGPEEVTGLDVERLTSVGFSRAKAGYIREIARCTMEGIVPTRARIARMSDATIVERLTEIKGVGRWSVEMFLIFGLGRPDVLPIHDFGIRKGFSVAYGRRKMPEPKAIERQGERWKPHRTVASWYLWRAADLK